MAISVFDQIAQLNSARHIVLGDAKLYPQIVEGILPIIGANARLELRRWGADFLAETFASPAVSAQAKESMGIRVLQNLKDLLEIPQEDVEVVKSVVQAAASIYGYVFRYIIANPNDVSTWNTVSAIKSNILKRWNTAAAGVRICCIKFVQKVVQMQTPGMVDPRRPDKNEISIALVPRDHPLMPPSRLEPEAAALLDRLLSVFHEETVDAIYASATLNCLGSLLRTRPSTYNKIVTAILNFNPFKLVSGSMSTKGKLQVKSLEKTTKILLLSVIKRNEESPLAGRIKTYVDRLEQSRIELFAAETASRKRGLPTEPNDGLDNAKRQRLGAEMPMQAEPGPLPPGPNSFAQLYTLTDDKAVAAFPVNQLPQDLVTRVTLALLVHIEAQPLDTAINHVRSRYLTLSKEANNARKAAASDAEEDYEPDFEPKEDQEQILNRADALPAEDMPQEVALGPFKLPQPPPLTSTEAAQIGHVTIDRVFGMINVLDESPMGKRQKPGMNRFAGSNYDRDAWVTILTRLATRASAGLQSTEAGAPQDTKALIKQTAGTLHLGDTIRESLYRHILEEFRARIGMAIHWLSEEWYNDRIQSQHAAKHDLPAPEAHYERWTLKVLDGIVPYLDAKDKLLLRFLSEIPVVTEAVLERVKGLAKDPERVDLAVKAIHYLILMKPPARDICIDAVEDLWRNYDDARAMTTKLMTKWRPEVLRPPDEKPNEIEKTVEAKDPPAIGTMEALKSPPAGISVATVG